MRLLTKGNQMNNDEYEALQGQLEAFNLVLTSLITSITPEHARRSVEHLQTSFEIHCENEREERRSDLTRVLVRESFVEAYVGLLNTACGRSS